MNAPTQEEGSKSDTENLVMCESEREAVNLFKVGAARLLNINEWNQFAGPMSATFMLTDKQGQQIFRQAAPGDYFKIDIPGPGSKAGNGFDWVKIESLDDFRDPTGQVEEISIRVRPASSPLSHDDQTAHFFDHEATSTFSVVRNGKSVKAEVHGRNETPNKTVDKKSDAIRNTLVAIGAISGLAKLQWKNLAKGLLKIVS